MRSVLVIGAGIGGIATAARLALHGYHVTIVEKNEQAGGRCGRIQIDGHCFDTGATLFLMPELYTQTFNDLGESINDHLDLQRVDPSYQIFFNDGTTMMMTSDLNTMQEQLEAIEEGSFGGFLRYLNEGYLNYKLSLDHLVQRDFRRLSDYFNFRNIYLVLRLKALVNHYRNLDNYFRDPRLKIAFTFQNMYMGLNPYEAPAIFSLLQYTEFADGVWYPKGGMYSIIEALKNIAEKLGVEIIYNTTVSRIVVNSRKASGVTLNDGTQIDADILVANADLPFIYQYLLPKDGVADRIENYKHGCSALIFYWGTNKQYPQLGPHNLFMAEDCQSGYDQIFKEFKVPDDPSFYVHAPVRIDPALAPEGQDTLMIAIPVGCDNGTFPQDWEAQKRRTKNLILKRLKDIGIYDLEEHIKFEVSFTPRDWQNRYNLYKGSTHGLSHDLKQMGYLRPHNQHKRYRNLFFVGASTHPGTGLPTVLVSARHVAERILEEVKVE